MIDTADWIIKRNIERYGEVGQRFPDTIGCFGTREQAQCLVDILSSFYSGCDHLFYIDDDE